MKTIRNNRGFTLIEIIVAVALVAILSAAIAPSVLNNIAQGRISRATSDVQAIASAVMRFKTDTGKFPRLAKGSHPDTTGEAFDFLVSSPGNWPALATGANWPAALTNGVTTNGSTEDFTYHLVFGRSRAATDSLYVRATNPANPNDVGFRQGLLSSDAYDPWGNKYVCNVAPLGEAGQAVWVLSAGQNGVLETAIAVAGTGASESVGGDDIGYRIQ